MLCDSEILVSVALLPRFTMGVEGLGLGCGKSLPCGHSYSMELKLHASIGLLPLKHPTSANTNVVNDN